MVSVSLSRSGEEQPRGLCGQGCCGSVRGRGGSVVGLCLLLHPRHASLAKAADDTSSGAVNLAPTSSREDYGEAPGSSCRCRFSRPRRTEEARSCGRVLSLKSMAPRVCQSPARPGELLSCIDAPHPCAALPGI